ncbi:hypothetical protein C8Q79DRAFT_903494 [Trametes meyenii]|nr:hypothetical protein C8Q79DRAFT_903494 [Trametes meyenii]
MYSSRPTYNSPPPELSNNPFIDHSSNALARFPDISGSEDLSGSSAQFTSWLNKPQTSAINTNQTGYFPQGATSPTGYSAGYQTPQPQSAGQWGAGGSGFSQPQQPYGQMMSPPAQPQISSGPFQPSSSFGQQLVGQVNGAYGAARQPQPQYSSGYPGSPQYGQTYQQGYPGQQQQPQYLSEFDPYSQGQGVPTSGPGVGAGQSTVQYGTGNRQHPRQFVQSHKVELETWDSYTWKQAQNSFEELKSAWELRKRELEARLNALGGAGLFGSGGGGYGGMYGGGPAQQYAQLENMAKEAGLHIDTVAAGAFQMQEVFDGYRQSNDIASKRRVREAINAALSSLPDWPQPLY